MQTKPFRQAADSIPALSRDLVPPPIRGAAWLAHRAYADHGLDDLLAALDRPAHGRAAQAALDLDRGLAHALRFRAAQAAALQDAALAECQMFRVMGAHSAAPLRVLALLAPGDLMVNTPLDFITAHLDVRLDLLFVRPGHRLPDSVPDHDVAFFAASEQDPAALRRLAPLYGAWPRPALNNPRAAGRLSRDRVASGMGALQGACGPRTIVASRAQLAAHCGGQASVDLLVAPGLALIRPVGSHAGQHLKLIADASDVWNYLAHTEGDRFFVTQFVDYRGADGLFRKYRVALIQGRPFLCHMAASEHWMVHYLNAGMAEHADRRMDEAHAMATFDSGFAARHAGALAAIHRWSRLDYTQLDCAETRDGRLLVFEMDTAAIVHLMDPPDLFAYKIAPMRRLFAAFEAMLRRVATGPKPCRIERQNTRGRLLERT